MDNLALELLLEAATNESTDMALCNQSIEQARVFYWQEVDRFKRLEERHAYTIDAIRYVCGELEMPESDAMNAYHNMLIHDWLDKGLIMDATEVEVGGKE